MNPTSLETSKIEDFNLAGVNRLSIGIQVRKNYKSDLYVD